MQPTMTTNLNGTIQYTLYDRLHREDGPAIIHPSGSQSWYLNGELHRLDGPAFIRANGTQSWWLNDKEYTFNNFCEQLKLSKEDIVFLKLKYNTCVVS